MSHGKMKVDFIDSGFIATMKSEGTREKLLAEAQRLVKQTGVDGFEVGILVGNTRCNAMIYATTLKALQAESENKVLSRLI